MSGSGPRRGPSVTRIVVWVAIAAIGVYLVVSGLIGIAAKG